VNGQQRATLARLADELIPSADGMPSASQAGVAGPLLDQVLALRPDFVAPLMEVVDRFATISEVQDRAPGGFAILTEVVAGGYFLSPEVREQIGYRGQQSVPIVSEDPPDYEQNGLLASVISRGPIYRPTPRR
jgi:hypothetical protein